MYCKICNLDKHEDEFHKDSSSKRGRAYYCKKCANSKGREYHNKYKNDPIYLKKKWDSYYLRNYNLTVDERISLLEQQNNKCAICELDLLSVGGNTHTDHDHKTGKIRGILCTNCNRGIGHFQENPAIIQAAIAYLEAHTANGKQKEGSCQ